MIDNDVKSQSRATRSTANGSRMDELAASARDVASQVEDQSARLIDRMPAAIEAARTSAVDAARGVEAMPERTRLVLATLSLGFAAGLYLAGAPRLVTLLAVTPAAVVAAGWMAREADRPPLD
jgi:hypothetical protein